jgi:flagellar motor component MotA
MAFVDVALTIIIIGGLILAVWAAISKQTIMGLFRDIADFIQERRENAVERYLD